MIKSVVHISHLAEMCLAFAKRRLYGLKVNQHECDFGVLIESSWALLFIIKA